jgi:hypothetical protein
MSLGEYLGAGSGVTKLLLHLNGNSNDDSGNSNNGSASNVSFVSDKFGQCGSFNGSNSKIDLPFILSGSVPNMTISFWVKTTQSYAKLVAQRSAVSTSGQWVTEIYDGKLHFWDYSTSYGFYTFSTLSINGGNWIHCVFVKISGTSGIIYLNGSLDSSHTGANRNYNSSLVSAVGYNRRDNIEYYNGLIDEIIVETRAWSAEEIKRYYTYAQGRFAAV